MADVSQCEQLHAHGSVGTVMTSHTTSDPMRHQKAPLQVRSYDVIQQTEVVEHSSPWTEVLMSLLLRQPVGRVINAA